MKNKEIVKQFLEQVRSGKFPEKAGLYLSDSILAHQMNSENETTVIRTPQNYSEHIEDFVKMFGQFFFEITDLIAEEDKVYARWKQIGNHLAEIEGYQPTGNPLIEIASCVYRLENNKIAEYWIQIDRLGFEKQLHQNG